MNLIKSSCVVCHVFTVILVLLVIFGAVDKASAQEKHAEPGSVSELTTGTNDGNTKAWIALAAAATMATSCIAAGYAVAKVGAAAMGAASEKPEIMGRAMLFVAIAEGIAIYGLIIAVFILNKI